jgi:predicted phage-related endonuclease
MDTVLLDKPTHGSIEWLLLRHRDETDRCVFGASEAPALMSASPYSSRADLWLAKSRPVTIGEMTPAFYRGQLLEPVLVAEASRRLRVDLATPDVMYRRDRLVATLDAVDRHEAPRLIVEAKTTARYRVADPDDLPPEWLWQAWAQHAVCPDANIVFCVLDRDQQINLIDAPPNPRAVEQLLVEARRFGEAIDAGGEPDDALLAEMDCDHIAAAYKTTRTAVELPAEAAGWLDELDFAKAMSAEAKQIERRARDEIARHLRGNEIGHLNGVKVVTWSLVNGRVTVDADALKQDLPDVYAKYARRGEPYRAMRLHNKNKQEEEQQ